MHEGTRQLDTRLVLDHSPCTWDCWKLFPGAKWKFPATCRDMSSHSPLALWSPPSLARPSHLAFFPPGTLLTSKKPYTWQPSFFCSCIFWLKPSRRHCSIVSGFLKAQPRRRYASRTSSQLLQHLQGRRRDESEARLALWEGKPQQLAAAEALSASSLTTKASRCLLTVSRTFRAHPYAAWGCDLS